MTNSEVITMFHRTANGNPIALSILMTFYLKCLEQKIKIDFPLQNLPILYKEHGYNAHNLVTILKAWQYRLIQDIEHIDIKQLNNLISRKEGGSDSITFSHSI